MKRTGVDIMRDKFNRFMQGRYGVDDFSRFLLGASVVLMLVNLLLRVSVLNFVVAATLVYIYVRMFSKDYQARYKENLKYIELRGRVKNFFGGRSAGGASGAASGAAKSAKDFVDKQKRYAEDRKTNHIYKCPSCGQKIRIPKGKGKICITCPKCKTEFTRKS